MAFLFTIKTVEMSYAENYQQILSGIPTHVTLIAVSKTHSIEVIEQVYNIGCRHFGENKVQEMILKHQSLPKDILWHMIGHLQTNKIKSIIPFVHLIHSIDSLKLLSEINKEASKISKVQNCLLQIHIAQEETKFGLTYDEITELLKSEKFQELKNVKINGLMGMASFTDDTTIVKKEFQQLKQYFDNIKEFYFKNNATFNTLSMGMSGDFKIAIEEGSNMIRIGTTIFGNRNYSNI